MELEPGQNPQHQHGHARTFRGQHEPPAGGQVQPTHWAPAFDEQRPEPGAARRFRRGVEQGCFVRDQAQQHRSRIEAEFAQPGRVELAGLLLRGFGPQPQQWCACSVARLSCPPPDKRSEARATADFVRFGEDFMHPAQREPPAERTVDRAMAQREQLGTSG